MTKEENFYIWQQVMLEYYSQLKSNNAIYEKPMRFIDWLRENYTLVELNQNKER